MDSFEDITNAEPPVIDPYEVLGLERAATESQVKSAYRKAALKHHPDKVAQDQRAEAHKTFQSIAFAYAILSDPARRRRYNETGSTSESIVDADGFSWTDYYRAQFQEAISSGAIEKFAKKYKRSTEEKDDVLVAYTEAEGRMDDLYERVILSDVLEDDARFRAIIDEAIASGDVPAFDAYTKETKKSRDARLKDAKKEAKEAEDYARELGVHEKLFGKSKETKGTKGKPKGKKDSEDALAALIKSRQADRGSFFDHLEAKYAGGAGKQRKMEEPPEEAFHATAARAAKGKATGPAAARKGRGRRAAVVESDDDEDEDQAVDEDEEEDEDDHAPAKRKRTAKAVPKPKKTKTTRT